MRRWQTTFGQQKEIKRQTDDDDQEIHQEIYAGKLMQENPCSK